MLELRLAPPAGAGSAPPVQTAFNKSLPVRVEALGGEVRRLRARLEALSLPDASAAYALEWYARADRGETNPHRVDLRAEFAAAHSILDHTAAVRRGDMRRAYRSDVDRTLQPYRLFVPAAYEPEKPAPLVVALHGMGGDENSMFEAYGDGLLKREAERLGFVVACPKGRGSAAMYRGDAERDVLDVLADVRQAYRIDPARIFLMGHSMGGYGTWSIAMARPELFAGLGPIAGGGNPAGVEKIARIPMYVVHGDADETVAVEQSRRMVEAAKKAGAEVVYVEVKGGHHRDVVVPQIAPMLEFFAGRKR